MNLDRLIRVLSLADGDYGDDEPLGAKMARAREYVDNHLYRAEIVQQLPAQSEPAHLYVVPGDPNLYVGGPGGTYRRIPTQAV